MRSFNFVRGLIIFLTSLGIASASFAGDLIEIVKADGKVMVSESIDAQNKKVVAAKSILPAKYFLETGSDGRAVIRVRDAGYIVVEKNSKVEFSDVDDRANLLRHITGIVYYALHSLKGDKPPIKIQTNIAFLGVRGTRFLVADTEERKEVGVRKGLVNVESPGEAFEIHRKEQLDEFEAFKREGKHAIAEEKRSFSEYQANTQKEFIEYKREFGLGANRMATFDGNRVVEGELSEASIKDIETIESYAKDWLDEVND